MKNKVSKRHIIGSLQHKILQWLAKHPNQNRQEIAKKLHRDYKSVFEAIRKLENRKYPYVETSPGTSKKNKPMPLYRLSEFGIAHILTNPKTDRETFKALMRKYQSLQIIQVFQFLEDHFDLEIAEEVRMYASMVYLATLNQVKRGAITKQQMIPLVYGTLLTYLTEVFPRLEAAKLKKALLDLVKANFKIPSIQKYL